MLNNKDFATLENFINSDKQTTTTSDGFITKTVQNGITYILYGNVTGENILSEHLNKMETIGFIYDGIFYNTSYISREYGQNFNEAVRAFEDKFNAAYAEKISGFTLENPAPITDVTREYDKQQYKHYDIEDYTRNYMNDDANRALFGVVYNSTKNYNERKFTLIFLDCLQNPAKFEEYLQQDIERHASEINYRIQCNALREKKIEELKQNPTLMRKVAMYKALQELTAKTVKIYCEFCGKSFEISVKRNCLMYDLAFSYNISLYNFTKTIRDKIEAAAIEAGQNRHSAKLLAENITKITYGKKIIFED